MLFAENFIDVRTTAGNFKSLIRFKAMSTGTAILVMSVILNYKIT